MKKEITEKDIQELRDEDIPKYAIQPFTTALLVKIARGDVDMKKLAEDELADRGLDLSGKWVGFKKAKRAEGRKSVKIMWMKDDQVAKISYADTADEAEKKITNSRDRRWGKALVFFWSDRLNRYVSVPE